MDPAAAVAAEEEEGSEKPPVIYTMENKPIVTCESLCPSSLAGQALVRVGGLRGQVCNMK